MKNYKFLTILGVIIMCLLTCLILSFNGVLLFEKKSFFTLTLDKENLIMYVGEKEKINIPNLPKEYSFESSDDKVAIVNKEGEIIAKKNGNVDILLRDGKGKIVAKINVKIEVADTLILVSNLTINNLEKELTIEELYQLNITIFPENATNKNLIWSSSNEKIAEVDNNGIVKAKNQGEVIITALTTDDSNINSSVKFVIVKPKENIIDISEIKLNDFSKTLNVGGSYQLEANIFPVNATNKKLIWTSDNTSVATISDTGLVKANKEGYAVITVTTSYGKKTATVKLTVQANLAV